MLEWRLLIGQKSFWTFFSYNQAIFIIAWSQKIHQTLYVHMYGYISRLCGEAFQDLFTWTLTIILSSYCKKFLNNSYSLLIHLQYLL